MGKACIVLGIIGLILAAGGLGLGSFAWISVSRLENQVVGISEQTTWYKYNETVVNCDPIFTYLTFSGLTIEFELGSNESVFFSFTSRAHTELRTSAWSRIFVYYRVDGILETEPSAEVGTYDGGFTINFMLNLQHVRDYLLSGVHTVTVDIYGESTANYIWKSSLFVQKVST